MHAAVIRVVAASLGSFQCSLRAVCHRILSVGVEDGGLETTEAGTEARELEARRGGSAAEKTKYTAKSSAVARKLGLSNKK